MDQEELFDLCDFSEPQDDEVTEERTMKRPIDRSLLDQGTHPTRRIPRIDAELLALARGDADPQEELIHAASVMSAPPPSDPWGGLIPVFDVTLTSIPRLLMGPRELVQLPIDHRAGFLLSHIDGTRTVQELVDICHLSEEDAMQVVEALVALGAIDIDDE
jgi:hypothetical protein